MESTALSVDPPLTFTRPRSQSDDEAAAISMISTDLSKYMATGNDLTASLCSTTLRDSDGDSDTTTITESLMPSHCAVTSPRTVETSDPQENGTASGCKLIRNTSFTVDIPRFTISNDRELDLLTDKNELPSVTSGQCLPDNANRRTPFQLTEDDIKEQLKRLSDMQISLKRYHQMQLDELRDKQRRELATLETQKAFLRTVLDDGNWIPSKLDTGIKKPSPVGKKTETACRKKPNRTIERITSQFFRKSSGHWPASTPIRRSPPPATGKAVANDASENSTRQMPAGRLEIPVILKTKLAGLVKGYLIRRWLRTEKIKTMTDTIKDLLTQLASLENEGPLETVDEIFKRSLILQLNTVKSKFCNTWQNQAQADRLAVISEDRHRKDKRQQKCPNDDTHPFGLVSSATAKSLARRSTTPCQSRLVTPCPSAASLYPSNGHRRNVIRISPRSKSTHPIAGSPRKRKRFGSFSPSFCLLRSPRPTSSTVSKCNPQRKRVTQRPSPDEDELSVNSSTTMNIRMTMNTVTRNQQQRWSGFYQGGTAAKTQQNRRPWR